MTRLNFFFPYQLLKRLKDYCDNTGFTMSDVIRHALDGHLDNKGF